MIVNIIPNITSDCKETHICEFASIQEAVDHFAITSPHIVISNGNPILRKDWGEFRESVDIVVVPGELMSVITVVTLVLTLVSLGVSIYYLSQDNSIASQANLSLPSPKDVFSFAGQSNLKKLNEPVEICYGKCRWYPPFYCLPRIGFDSSNRTFMDIYLSLGSTDAAVEDVRIGDDLLSGIPGCSYEVIDKGTTIGADRPYDVVFISDKTNVELNAPNDDSYEPIVIITNPPNTKITAMQISLSWPGGAYAVSGGNIVATTIAVELRFRAVDNAGQPITGWLYGPGNSQTLEITYTGIQYENYRYSYELELPSIWVDNYSRFEVEVRRSNNAIVNKNDGTDKTNLVSIYGLARSAKPSPVNLLRVKLAGSSSVGEDSATKINCFVTRKLDGEPSRSAVKAIVDILKSDYGMRIAESDLDMDYWTKLAQDNDFNFDYIFTEKTTAWDAISTICAQMKASPCVVGSDVRVSFDRPDAIPTTLFTQDNANDMVWNVKFPSELEFDCVETVYTDLDSGLQSSVMFVPPGSTMENPKTITLKGCTSRDQAWRVGAYTYQKMSIGGDIISFKTGLDGLIPLYGDVISVAWPFPEWSQAGVIVSKDGDTIEVSEEITQTGDLWISLRSKSGSNYGPVRCTKVDAYHVDVSIPYGAFDFDNPLVAEALYTLGSETVIRKNFRVTGLSESGGEVSVDALEHNPSYFIYDSFNAPVNDRVAYSADFTSVPWISVSIDSDSYFKVIFPTIPGRTYEASYAYNPDTGEIAEAVQLDPTSHAFTMTDLDIFQTEAYIPRQTGRLYIKVVTTYDGNSYENWWRSGYNYAIATRVVNSLASGESYVGQICINQGSAVVEMAPGEGDLILHCDYIKGEKPAITIAGLSAAFDEFGNCKITRDDLINANLAGTAISVDIDNSMDITLTQNVANKYIALTVSEYSNIPCFTLASSYWGSIFGEMQSVIIAASPYDGGNGLISGEAWTAFEITGVGLQQTYINFKSYDRRIKLTKFKTASAYIQTTSEAQIPPSGLWDVTLTTSFGQDLLTDAQKNELATGSSKFMPVLFLDQNGNDSLLTMGITDNRCYCVVKNGANNYTVRKATSATYNNWCVNIADVSLLDGQDLTVISISDRVVIAPYKGSAQQITPLGGTVRAEMVAVFSPTPTLETQITV